VRLIGQGSGTHRGRGLVVLRPEHLEVSEAPDGPAGGSPWRVLRRRFSGTEILYEIAAADGERLWVEAGHAVRRLRLGDAVDVRLRPVETVFFGATHGHAATGLPVTAGRSRLLGQGHAELPDPLDRLAVEGVAEHDDDLADADVPVAPKVPGDIRD
jgi:hypothetical protein